MGINSAMNTFRLEIVPNHLGQGLGHKVFACDDFLPILRSWKLEEVQERAIITILLEENLLYGGITNPIYSVYSKEVGITA